MTISDIKSDEVVVFYPTCAPLEETSQSWQLPIHGIIYEPEMDSHKRALLMSLIRRSIQLSKEDVESKIFKSRFAFFLVDNEGGKQVSIRLGRKLVPLPQSSSNGHFRHTVAIHQEDAVRLVTRQKSNDGWLRYQAVADEGDSRSFVGHVQLIPSQGVSIISDIDDTIKESQVLDKKQLIRNTFLRKFKAVAGMAELYASAAEEGVAVHYLSASPWQLYQPLAEFFAAKGFPRGTFHMRHFRLKDSTASNLLTSPEDYKSGEIKQLLERFPARQFVLVGDSGEKDPEIYGQITRDYSKQIAAIYIRNVTDQSPDDPRFQAAFENMSSEKWLLFTEAKEIRKPLKRLTTKLKEQ